MMKRREFLKLLGLAPAALPMAASAMAQTGLLLPAHFIPGELVAGVAGSAELGGVAGRPVVTEITIDARGATRGAQEYANAMERAQAAMQRGLGAMNRGELAAELDGDPAVREQVDADLLLLA